MKDEVKKIWNANAEFWDGRMGEGNDFHKLLVEPIQLKLLNIQAGDRILDIACGNGQFARRMAEFRAEVTAIDFSDRFIAIAELKGNYNINYQVIDVTSEAELEKLPRNEFDAIVCTMSLMDIKQIDSLIKYVPKMLKRSGVFVFSILHPCFNSGENILVHEMEDLGGEVKDKYYVKIQDYLTERSLLGIGIIGQPEPQYYFHRPISAVLRVCFENGLVLDAFEEPSFTDIKDGSSIFDNVYAHIPPACICRLKISEDTLSAHRKQN